MDTLDRTGAASPTGAADASGAGDASGAASPPGAADATGAADASGPAGPAAPSRLAGPDRLVAERRGGVNVLAYADRVTTIVGVLERGVLGHGGSPLLTDSATGRTVTYAEFAALVEGAAARLVEVEGLRPGDRFALAARNGLDIAVAIWACARARLVFLGLPTSLAPPQWAYMLEHAGVSLALAQPELTDALAAAASQAGLDPSRAREVGDHLTGASVRWRAGLPMPDQDATYAVIYTSGTTGRPKASRMTHRATAHAAEYYVRTLGLTPADRTAIHLPFSYLSGHVTQLTPVMLAGGSAVTVPEFEPPGLVRLLASERVTFLDVVPSIWTVLLRTPGFGLPELAGVRVAVYGGAPMPTATVRALRERLPQLRLFDVYGMTETSAPISVLLDAEMERRAGSVGRPVPFAEVRLVDDADADVPLGAPGELLVRGPHVTPGYWGDPRATAAAIADGWLRTGDYARMDPEGYLFVLDRKKDMIIRGGVKVFSAEVEAVLLRDPCVAEAAVVGVPDRLAFQAVAAFVVAAPGRVVVPASLQSLVRTQIAAHAVPRHVRVLDALPRNRTGKVDKLALRELVTGPTSS